MASSDRTKIPEAIKREVRQRCGFGCVLCGQPITEYEHIAPYAKVKVHEARNITLLCAQCHRKKTKGLISMEAIQQANADPYVVRNGTSVPEVIIYPNSLPFMFQVGSCSLIATTHVAEIDAIVIDSVSLMKLRNENGILLISFAIIDCTGSLLVFVEDNHLTTYPSAWDIKIEGRHLIVRQDPIGTSPFCLVEIHNNSLHVKRWETTFNGKTIRVFEDGTITLEPQCCTLRENAKVIQGLLDVQGNPIGPPVSAVGVVNDGESLNW